MAQTGFTPISIYYSSTATNVPTAGNLVAGELAINTADGKLFYKDSSNVVQVIGTKGGVGSSSTTQVLYNSSGLVVGSANMTFSGTALTLANDASISGLTVGKGGGAVSGNTVVGSSAGNGNTTGAIDAFGNAALGNNTSGNYNAAFGYQSLQTNSTGGFNAAFGRVALNSNTTGSYNTGIGVQALQANTTASYNTAVGSSALVNNTTGAQNTALGYQAGYANTTASYNTAVGYQANYTATTGAENTSLGYVALRSATTGSNNIAVGSGTLYSSTTASNNTAIGYGAGYYITTGQKNTILGGYSGNQGGLDIRTSSNYIVLSDGDGVPRLYIDTNGNLNCQKVYDTTTANAVNVHIRNDGFLLRSTSALKYKQDIRDLESIDINKFRPVRYKSKSSSDDQTKDYFGFIADEVDAAGVKELVQYGLEGEVEGFSYDRLTAVLVKTIQDLQKRIEILENK